MGIFSKRKDSKRSEGLGTESEKTPEGPPIIRLNTSGSSLPRLESDKLRIPQSTPAATQRPCLKRVSQSDSSIYLKMHAANNRLSQRASQNVHFGEFTEPVSTSSSRSSSTTRSSKQVSFKLDTADILEHRKSQNVRHFQKAMPLSIPNEDSDSDDWHEPNSVASSVRSRSSSHSSWSSDYSSSIKSPTSRPSGPVASGFERKMSKLPPVQIRNGQSRPKIALGHSKNGTPKWSLKARPRSVAAH